MAAQLAVSQEGLSSLSKYVSAYVRVDCHLKAITSTLSCIAFPCGI
jgi:hypothetical protein